MTEPHEPNGVFLYRVQRFYLCNVEAQVSGLLMEKELKYLKGAVDSPVRPMACIVGGAKVSSKVKTNVNASAAVCYGHGCMCMGILSE